MSEIADAIGGTLGDLFGEAPVAETEEAAPAAPAPEAEVVAQEEEESWDFDALSRDLTTVDEDEEPDFSALADEELSTLEEQEDEFAPTEYDDEQTRALKKAAAAARKKAEYHERRHLETARKSWEADVKKQSWGELVDFSSVTASSHRDFIRQAKTQAQRNFQVLKPHLERIAAEKAKLREVATAEAREVAENAWGRPSVSNVHQPPQKAVEKTTQERVDNAMRRGNMHQVVKAMIDGELI